MRIGFIGSGNMAAAMARGWKLAGVLDGGLATCDAGSGRAAALAEELDGKALATPAEVVEASDLVVLAVKPTALPEIGADLSGTGNLVISVLAGVGLDSLAEHMPRATLVRAMPNVCVEIGEGVTCWSGSDTLTADARAEVARLFDALGRQEEMPEGSLDAATAAMSCSVAYFALVAEALADAVEIEGLPAKQAGELVAATLAGTGILLDQLDPLAVRTTVASPGGSTAAGLAELEAAGVVPAIGAAVAASIRRMRGE